MGCAATDTSSRLPFVLWLARSGHRQIRWRELNTSRPRTPHPAAVREDKATAGTMISLKPPSRNDTDGVSRIRQQDRSAVPSGSSFDFARIGNVLSGGSGRSKMCSPSLCARLTVVAKTFADMERTMAGSGSSGTSADEFERGHASVPDAGATTPLAPSMGGAVETKTSEMPHLRSGDDEAAVGAAGAVAPATEPVVPGRAGGGGLRALRGVFWLLAVVGVVVALVLGVQAAGWWPQLRNPFGSKTTDRSQPVLLTSIQDLSRFVAAEGNFQVVIDLQNDRKYIPNVLVNERTLFVAAGTVEAYVDFGTIGQGAITDSADHKSVQIRLPAPALGKPNLNHEKSYVFAEQRGLFNRAADLFAGDPNRLQALYLVGEQKISDAAKDSELAPRARDNTQKMLDAMLKSLGYSAVTITFAAP
jgi:hypothetical protein